MFGSKCKRNLVKNMAAVPTKPPEILSKKSASAKEFWNWLIVWVSIKVRTMRQLRILQRKFALTAICGQNLMELFLWKKDLKACVIVIGSIRGVLKIAQSLK